MKTVTTDYDVDSLISSSKKRLHKTLILLVSYSIIFTASILAVIFLGSFIPVFIIGIVAACISVFLTLKQLRAIRFSDFKTSHGEIADVLKEATTKRSITGGYGMYVTRKYDAFAKATIKLTVSIKNPDQVNSYILEGVTEDHAKYYESKGNAIHIYGTHYPVKTKINQDKWVCPVCGEFNAKGEKICANCREKVLK